MFALILIFSIFAFQVLFTGLVSSILSRYSHQFNCLSLISSTHKEKIRYKKASFYRPHAFYSTCSTDAQASFVIKETNKLSSMSCINHFLQFCTEVVLGSIMKKLDEIQVYFERFRRKKHDQFADDFPLGQLSFICLNINVVACDT